MKTQLFKVVGEDDEKTCPDCAEWQGKIVAGTEDGIHPTIDDFMNSKAFHPNCRCALRPIIEEEKEMKKEAKKTLEEMAMNTANFEDEIVYRGFVKQGIEEDEYNFDDRWTMIAPLGEYIGNTTTGETVKEIFTAEDYEAIVFRFHSDGIELPLDRDHASMKKPLERDTQAYAWITDLKLMSGGADAYNGLYAKFRWTGEGRSLVLSRAYRFLSPVFTLDEEGHPTALVNVALTNRPNFDLPPIFNTVSSAEAENNPISEEHTMNIEELKDAIVEGVMERIQALNTKQTCEEKVEEEDKEKPADTTCEDVSQSETTETPCEEEEKPTEEPVEPTEEPVEQTEEKPDEKGEEKPEDKKKDDEEEKKEEVITEEVMNTVPNTITPNVNTLQKCTEWRNLRGAELLEWARKHPYD